MTELPTASGALWSKDWNKVCELARALADAGFLFTAAETIRYFEKPWAWNREREWLNEHGTMDGFPEKP